MRKHVNEFFQGCMPPTGSLLKDGPQAAELAGQNLQPAGKN